MKYKVRISDRSYEVEIEDIHARPIIAHVDGQKFEVQPENGGKLLVQRGSNRNPNRLSQFPNRQSKLEAETK